MCHDARERNKQVGKEAEVVFIPFHYCIGIDGSL